jgi:hypothetical protein
MQLARWADNRVIFKGLCPLPLSHDVVFAGWEGQREGVQRQATWAEAMMCTRVAAALHSQERGSGHPLQSFSPHQGKWVLALRFAFLRMIFVSCRTWLVCSQNLSCQRFGKPWFWLLFGLLPKLVNLSHLTCQIHGKFFT